MIRNHPRKTKTATHFWFIIMSHEKNNEHQRKCNNRKFSPYQKNFRTKEKEYEGNEGEGNKGKEYRLTNIICEINTIIISYTAGCTKIQIAICNNKGKKRYKKGNNENN